MITCTPFLNAAADEYGGSLKGRLNGVGSDDVAIGEKEVARSV